MQLEVTIERDGAVIARLELGPGEYGIGRAGDNAVVLPDRAVSSHHALLKVAEKQAEIIDQGSLNGVYVAGKKIGKLAFTRTLTAEIGGFRLRAAPRRQRLAGRSILPAPGPRAAILLATVVLALGAFGAAWIPARRAMTALHQHEALERGVQFAHALAEQNVLPLRAKLLDQVRVTPVVAEDGVRQAMVADRHGKILAPAKDLGQALDLPEAAAALKEDKLRLWTDAEGATVLACPIRDTEGVLGVAVLVYDPRAVPAPATATGLVVAVPLVCGLWVAVVWFLSRRTLRPVRLLAEDIGVAIKTGARELTFRPPGRDFAELTQAAERLLLLAQADGPAPPAPRETASGRAAPPGGPAAPQGDGMASRSDRVASRSDNVAFQGDGATSSCDVGASSDAVGSFQSDLGLSRSDNVASPGAPGTTTGGGVVPPAADQAWCLIDLAGYRLLDWNPAFAAHLSAPDLAPPVHLLTALADPGLLAAVAGLVEDPAAEAARPVENRPLVAVKDPGATPGTARVRLTETA